MADEWMIRMDGGIQEGEKIRGSREAGRDD